MRVPRENQQPFSINSGGVTRRVMALGALAAAPLWSAPREQDRFTREILALERHVGGRIGVVAHDSATGRTLMHRASERFAMASTFKWLLAALILTRVDKGILRLDQQIPYRRADLLPHAPVTEAHVREGQLPLAVLTAAIVEVSDNGAANLLLRLCGGPPALTGFLRGLGDPVTRLDRFEMALNENRPGDPRDTTTPAAMAATMQVLLAGEMLSAASRARLIGWMRNCATGQERLRAGLPKSWRVADKTGTGERGAINDLAIAWPAPGRAPILIACYMSDSNASIEMLEGAEARIGALVGQILA